MKHIKKFESEKYQKYDIVVSENEYLYGSDVKKYNL